MTYDDCQIHENFFHNRFSPLKKGQDLLQETTSLIAELRALIGELGADGGLISPSLYDTAQVLRYYPPKEGSGPALRWLMSQQQPDGGWGDPAFPLTRDMPTLAAILALTTHFGGWQNSRPVQAALQFLNGQAPHWHGKLPNDIPVAAELIIPKLLNDAIDMQIPVPAHIYSAVRELGERRRQLILSIQPRAGTTAAFSWEAWGVDPDIAFLDGLGSVGHSPAATAAWLQKACYLPGLDSERSAAEEYLRQASTATQSDIPGLYSSAWPIRRFEQAFGLYALLLAGIMDQPELQAPVQMQIESLQEGMGANGIGFADFFEPDGDDTAALVAVLAALGRPEALSTLDSYRRDGHFSSYPYELQPSLSVTARAIHAFRVSGASTKQWTRSIVDSQEDDGRWRGDKWNVSWIYTSMHMIFACDRIDHREALMKAKQVLLQQQFPNGSWGTNGCSSQYETSLAVIGLHRIMADCPDQQIQAALVAAFRWMREAETGSWHSTHKLWLNKELYTVPRIERVFVLAAKLLLMRSVDSRMHRHSFPSGLHRHDLLAQPSILSPMM